MTALPAEIPRAARAVIGDLGHSATTPVKALICGGIGTGKTTFLAAARDTLRRAGISVRTSPAPDDPPGAALVVDDAHLLTDAELLRLTERVADAGVTVVAAAEAYDQRPELSALATAIERERPRICLPPLRVAEPLLDCTAGLPFLVDAVSERRLPDQSAMQAARSALVSRLRRLDQTSLDTLLIMTLTQEIGATDVAAALDISTPAGIAAVDRACAGGLVEPTHPPAFLQVVHDAVVQIVGNRHHRQVESSLLRSQLDTAAASPSLALRLAEHGLRDEKLAAILAGQAAAAQGEPARAVRLYEAAVRAGATELTSHLADALARTGDCAAAATVADDLLGSQDSAERAAAVRIAASVATHDGNTGHAAELFGWLGPYPDAVVGAAAAIVLAAVGDLTTAQVVLRPKDSGPPTLAARSSRCLAEGLLHTMDQPYPIAMASLSQAITAERPMAAAFPDNPASLITLAAIHGGDPVRAHSVIARAIRTGTDELHRRRHLLLSGWIKMLDGQLASAAVDVAAAGTDLHRRDALWAAALHTAIARRSGDGGALAKHWHAALEVLAEYSVDLFTLLPLGELWVAAARLREADRLEHTLDRAFALLRSLGNPALWANSLHWAGVHAAILNNSPESVAPHGQALGAAAAHSVLAQTLSGAGRTWLRVLAGQVDSDDVAVAARSLAKVGLTSDATRLAGQAALQAPDARVSGAMLQLARDLKVVSDFGEIVSTDAAAEPLSGGPSQPATGTPLSGREREVAELLLLGMPYRDIGGQLFISAKTVEHHVARIRRRLGAESRSEMLSMLRAMLAPQD